jgi:hypothetical protein
MLSSIANCTATASVAKFARCWARPGNIETGRALSAVQNGAVIAGSITRLRFGVRRCCAAFKLKFSRPYGTPIVSLSAATNFLFCSIVPTEMRTHSGKP